MKTFIKNISLLMAIALTFSSCAAIKTASPPGADLSKYKKFYVQHFPDDNIDIDRMISDRLEVMGYTSSFGNGSVPNNSPDAIVTYQDKWYWDITLYLIRLKVQIRDAKTKKLIASIENYRPSLQRRRPETMVEEVLTEMFKK